MWSRTFLFVFCVFALSGGYTQDVGDDEIEYIRVPSGESSEYDYVEPNNGLIADMAESGCECVFTLCQCCANAKINENEHQLCVVGGFDDKTLTLTIRIIVDYTKFWERSYSAKALELCAPVPLPLPLSFFQICLGTYDWEFALHEERAHVCIYALLKAASFSVFSVDFNCLQYLNKAISFRTDIKFTKKGLFHLNLNGLNPEFSINLHDIVREKLEQTAMEIQKGYKAFKTSWQKAEFIFKRTWEMTPAHKLIEGAKEVGPLLKGVAEWVVSEAMESVKMIAQEWSNDMEGMNWQKRKSYLAKKLWAFTPINLLKKGIEAVTPFIKSVIQFASKKLATAYDDLRAQVAKNLEDWSMQPEQLYEEFKVSLQVAVKVVGDVVTTVADSVTSGFKRIGKKIHELSKKVSKMVDSLDVKGYLDKILGPASPLVLIGKEIAKVGEYIVNKVNEAVEVIKQTAVQAVQAVERAVTKVKDWFWGWFG